ncbi:MAG: suppressor of fused domain protein [Bryobacteraceae bacterium]|nr:suppressor of fused domain protein [Bryobacteraceae bacterium]
MAFGLKDITRHIERNIGPIKTVFHEIISDDLHIDVHHVSSNLFRRYEVLVTSGMSARPMAVPTDTNLPRFAEMLVVLPKGWPLSKRDFEDERKYWPLRLIKDLARYVHHGNTWLGFGHTVASGPSEDTTKPYADGTSLCACIILPPSSLGAAAWSMKSKSGDELFFWAAVPIYMSELKFKFENGVDPLLDLFDRHKVTDRIDPNRPSVVT